MNGSRYLLDTNAIIQLLDGNSEIDNALNGAGLVAISVTSEIEYLSYGRLSDIDIAEYNAFRACTSVFSVPSDDPIFSQLVITARRKCGMKLPDAIIAATARANDLTVLTADEHFKKLRPPWKVKFYGTKE